MGADVLATLPGGVPLSVFLHEIRHEEVGACMPIGGREIHALLPKLVGRLLLIIGGVRRSHCFDESGLQEFVRDGAFPWTLVLTVLAFFSFATFGLLFGVGGPVFIRPFVVRPVFVFCVPRTFGSFVFATAFAFVFLVSFGLAFAAAFASSSALPFGFGPGVGVPCKKKRCGNRSETEGGGGGEVFMVVARK